MEVSEVLEAVTRRLMAALGHDRREARLEAKTLVAHVLEVERAWLIAHDRDVLSDAHLAALDALVARRELGHPIAYLLGWREFYGRPFMIMPGVLIPRPETELLVERALELAPENEPLRVLDVGTGSGVIAITLALERPHWTVCALDRSETALACSSRNAIALGASVDMVHSDIFNVLVGGRFDLILSNPPYVPRGDPHLARGDLRFEPQEALVAGQDGLEIIRRLVTEAPRWLVSGGHLLLEHGWDQAEPVAALLRSSGFEGIRTWSDLAGKHRVSEGVMP